jgi:hypothetical protein
MIKHKVFYVLVSAVLTLLKADTSFSEPIQKLPVSAVANSTAGSQDVLLSQASALPVHDAHSYPSLAAAVTSIGASSAVLVVSNQLAIPSNISIPSTIQLKFSRGGQLLIAKNAIVSINGPVDAGLELIFAGEGLVKFNKTAATKVYPQWWGAKGDGSTEDTQAVQKAINTVAIAGGGDVIFSKGIYIVNSIVLDSNVNMVGQGWDSILLQKSGATYGVSVNPGNGGTPNSADNKHDITIRDIQFRGTVESDGFSEHVHLLNMNAVTNVTVTQCKFVGWRGDAIYIGSSNVPKAERHNINVVIKNSYFDGVNNDNRNGISVIDGSQISIDHNTFINSSKPTMPGAIDIEPNRNDFTVINNITIKRNKFSNIGGGAGIISVVFAVKQQDLKTSFKNIIIDSNEIDGRTTSTRSVGILLKQNQDANDSTPSNNVTVTNNIIKYTSRPFIILGFKGVRVVDNTFEESTNAAMIANKYMGKCQDLEFAGNNFKGLGNLDGSGIIIYDVNHLSFIKNTFDSIGILSDKNGILVNFHGGTIDWVRIENNIFIGDRATYAIYKDPSTKATLEHNRVSNNIFQGPAKVNLPAIN